MDSDLPAALPSLGDPETAAQLLTQIHPIELGAAIIVGFLAPWLCGRLLNRKLGVIAYMAVGTMASVIAVWVLRQFGEFAAQHTVVSGLVIVVGLLSVLLVLSMRRQ